MRACVSVLNFSDINNKIKHARSVEPEGSRNSIATLHFKYILPCQQIQEFWKNNLFGRLTLDGLK